MTDKEMNTMKAANAAIEAATEHIREQRKTTKNLKIKVYCLTALLIVAMICAAVVACFAIYAQQQTIIEQQYALNMQYSSLADLLYGAEITTSEYTAQSDGDGSISVAGDNNTTAGGDVIGK